MADVLGLSSQETLMWIERLGAMANPFRPPSNCTVDAQGIPHLAPHLPLMVIL